MPRSAPALFLSDSDDSVEIIEPVKKKTKLRKEERESLAGPIVISGEGSPDITDIVSSKSITLESSLQPIDINAARRPHDEEFAELDAWLQSGGVDIV